MTIRAKRSVIVAGVAMPAEAPRGRIPTMVRFDAALLDKVNAAAKNRGITRSAWIQYILSEAIETHR
jgi:hypothetical protein